jgi:hypothetical protein
MKKLTEQQFFELQDQFDRTPGIYDGEIASGEHYILMALLRRFGYATHGREEALRLAEELLTNGYE